MNRQQLLVAVWKEKLTYNQSISSAEEIVKRTKGIDWPFKIAIAPNPFSFVGVSQLLSKTVIKRCSQNVLWIPQSGSYIGETTIQMLIETGCEFVIVGHSERRLHFGESNEMIASRALAAFTSGICPILCIGDTADDKEKGRSIEVMTMQLRAFFEQMPKDLKATDFMIAYEPVWAISTWRTAQPLPSGVEIQALHAHLRELISAIKTSSFADQISLLYGGSVAPDNAEDYMAQADVDGGLVGGASKTPDSFVETIQAAMRGFKAKA